MKKILVKIEKEEERNDGVYHINYIIMATDNEQDYYDGMDTPKAFRSIDIENYDELTLDEIRETLKEEIISIFDGYNSEDELVLV